MAQKKNTAPKRERTAKLYSSSITPFEQCNSQLYNEMEQIEKFCENQK